MPPNTPSPTPVALITGGASGIGLHIAEHLVQRGWNVTIVDYDDVGGKKAAERLGSQTFFAQADVSDYDQQAAAFAKTWERWARLDFVVANAGVADTTNFYTQEAEPREDGAPPPRPNTAVLDIGLMGVVYSAYLGLHYFRRNKEEGKIRGGKIVATASMCGLYAAAGMPGYTAAKHGVVGLTRALGGWFGGKGKGRGEGVTVNCICPGLVDTSLTAGTLVEVADERHVTPMSTIVRAVEGFLEDGEKNGLVAECSVGNIHYREQMEYGDEEARWLMTADWEEMLRAKMAGDGEVEANSSAET
ncbi:NAD(P)-binding protein [Polyplosphaeria fusca]|uniref:NAD(P)-binding protein n=1 Tax=Polyplosphaeria fusca TaxID=682080 RepID=A0A9P4V0R3_9PLEO|nr:NAD(P)-binding protein [Polyplosphaeria fusca]